MKHLSKIMFNIIFLKFINFIKETDGCADLIAEAIASSEQKIDSSERISELFIKYLNEDYQQTKDVRPFHSLNFIIENKSKINVVKLDWDGEEHDLQLLVFKAFLNCK
jgi:hypothetical protein